jgi:type II secretory pathway component PulJ
MDCKITSTTRRARLQGMTLVEVMFAVAIGSLVCVAVISTLLFSLRSYAALTNFQDLNSKGRLTLDILSRDIRQASGCSTNATFSTTSLTLRGTNVASLAPYTINYRYNPTATTLTRTYSDANGSLANVLLTNCTYFAFSYFLRNPTNASFGVFTNDTGRADLCKLVQVDWNCARNILGSPVDMQNGESARIVIRKE